MEYDDENQPDPEEVAFNENAKRFSALNEIRSKYFSFKEDLMVFDGSYPDAEATLGWDFAKTAFDYAKDRIKEISSILDKYSDFSESSKQVWNYLNPLRKGYRSACCDHINMYIEYEFQYKAISLINEITILLTALPLDIKKEYQTYAAILGKAASITDEYRRLWEISVDIQVEDGSNSWIERKGLPTKALEIVRDGPLAKLGEKVSLLRQEYFKHHDYSSTRLNRWLLVTTTIFAVIAGLISIIQLFTKSTVRVETPRPIQIEQETK